MFILFSNLKINYKLASQKGQIAPFLIAILAIIIMATMITVNIGKIGVFKTHVSNTVDAGALAGASIMASAFDYLVYLSAMMYAQYWSYYLMGFGAPDSIYRQTKEAIDEAIGWYVAGALLLLGSCIGGLAALGAAAKGWQVVTVREQALAQLIKDAYKAQKDFYKEIRKIMVKWVDQAKDAAYEYAGANTGGADNYTIDVELPYIQAYDLYVTRANILKMDDLHDEFDSTWLTAFGLFTAGTVIAGIGCALLQKSGCLPCIIIGMILLVIAMALILATAYFANDALDQLLKEMRVGFSRSPNLYVDDSDPLLEEGNTGLLILVAVQDVEHPRTVKVDSTQSHAGADLGLWRTQYPDISGTATGKFDGGIIDPLNKDPVTGDIGGLADHAPRLIAPVAAE